MTLQALASLAIFEMLFYSWQQLPFACSYAPGKRPLASIVGRYLAAIFFLAPALSIIIATVSQMAALFAFFAAAFGALWLWVRRERRQGWGEAKLIYEDDPGALADLGLERLTLFHGLVEKPVGNRAPDGLNPLFCHVLVTYCTFFQQVIY